jgi:hypothetical protein
LLLHWPPENYPEVRPAASATAPRTAFSASDRAVLRPAATTSMPSSSSAYQPRVVPIETQQPAPQRFLQAQVPTAAARVVGSTEATARGGLLRVPE